MFEEIIKRLLELHAPATRKLKIPLAGTKAFDAILDSEKILEGNVVDLAVSEFAKYSRGDHQLVSKFREILLRELSGLRDRRLIKKKVRALREIWEAEARTLAVQNRRNKWLSIRVTEGEYELVVKQAQQEGLDLSNYIRKKLGLEYKP
ncbi:plasmid mobilization protein [Palaeococcus ferrophilus]|uniref:plasmid mobilization protein n=1 Tax=Palaeococcus ferrophilus TaxID=83868 RepID=UPI00064FD74A|nr:hypothetical protein [Palaeococcus ferrophilus]